MGQGAGRSAEKWGLFPGERWQAGRDVASGGARDKARKWEANPKRSNASLSRGTPGELPDALFRRIDALYIDNLAAKGAEHLLDDGIFFSRLTQSLFLKQLFASLGFFL